MFCTPPPFLVPGVAFTYRSMSISGLIVCCVLCLSTSHPTQYRRRSVLRSPLADLKNIRSKRFKILRQRWTQDDSTGWDGSRKLLNWPIRYFGEGFNPKLSPSTIDFLSDQAQVKSRHLQGSNFNTWALSQHLPSPLQPSRSMQHYVLFSSFNSKFFILNQ